MNQTVITYLIYLAVSASFTIWVAQTLHRNGRPFLVHMFKDNYALADSINHLLVVGFYLINLGYIGLCLKTEIAIPGWQSSIEVLATKVGLVLLALGVMHFLNMGIFAAIKMSTPLRTENQMDHHNL